MSKTKASTKALFSVRLQLLVLVAGGCTKAQMDAALRGSSNEVTRDLLLADDRIVRHPHDLSWDLRPAGRAELSLAYTELSAALVREIS